MSAICAQGEFASWLRQPSSLSDAAMRAPVAGVDIARLSVHRNTFLVTLIDMLADSFPVSQALTGAEFFRDMARQRVLADPPRTPVLTDYAISFPRHVADYPPAAAIPFLASVARLESLRLQAYHAADATPVDRSEFHPLVGDPDRLASTCVRLHPAARWLRSRHAVLSLWAAHQDVHELAAIDLGAIDPNRSEDVLVTRPALSVAVSLLPPGGLAFLDALSEQRSLGAALADAVRNDSHTEPAALFTLLIQHRLVVALSNTTEDLQ